MTLPLHLHRDPDADALWSSSSDRVRRVLGGLGLLVGAGLIALVASTSVTVIVLAAMIPFAVIAVSLVISRPSYMMEIAIVTMWFELLGFGPIRMGRVIAVMITLVMAARIAFSRWRPAAFDLRAWLPVTVFFLYAFVSAFWSTELTAGWFFGISQLYLALTYFLLFLTFTTDEPRLHRLMRLWVLVGAPIALLGVIGFAGFGGRIIGFTGGPNVYAVYLMEAMPISVVLIRREVTTRGRMLFAGVLLIYLAALVATGSRGGLVSCGAMAVYIFVTLPGLSRRRRMASIVLGGIAIVGGILLAAIINPDRFSLAGFVGDAGAGRAEIWNAAVQTVNERPVFGSGISTFRTQVLDLLTKVSGGSSDVIGLIRQGEIADAGKLGVHNMYLELLLDTGIVGLALWGVAYVAVAFNLWKMRGTRWAEWAWAFLGIHLGRLVNGLFDTQYNQKMHWVVYGFAGSLYFQRLRTERRTRESANVGVVDPLPRGQQSWLGPDADPLAAPIDMRTRVPFRRVLMGSMAVGAVLGFGLTFGFGQRTATVTTEIFPPNMEEHAGRPEIRITDGDLFALVNLARSGAFAAQVKEMAFLDEPVEEVQARLDATRTRFGAIIELEGTFDTEAEAERVGRIMVPALERVIELFRAGAVTAVDLDGRNLAPELSAEYEGPLFVRTYDQPYVVVSAPRIAWHTLLGMLTGGLLAFVGALVVHGRNRLTSVEDISLLLKIPQVASVKRLSRRSNVDAADQLAAATDVIAASRDGETGSLGVSGIDTGGESPRLAFGMALAQIVDGTSPDVVIVDLDAGRAGWRGRLTRRRSLSSFSGLSRKPGAWEVAAGSVAPEDACYPVPPRRVPRSLRRTHRSVKKSVKVMPFGTHRGEPLDDAALAGHIRTLAETNNVVVHFGPVPGPIALQSVYSACDTATIGVLDGWTPIENAALAVDTLDAVIPRRVGFVLIEN